jgi:hypothetical protein
MTEPPTATQSSKLAARRPVRPHLALRVGVTGTRALPPSRDIMNRLTCQVREVLQRVKGKAETFAADPHLRAVYAPDPDNVLRPELRLLSPLAEGADRLVARIALELGFRLEVAIPFAQADYERDFQPGDRDAETNAASLAEFRALLARAGDGALTNEPRVLALDGGRGEDEAASYGAVGRLVVRNCDLLIALWDGRAGKGPGGTADTVLFAARSGPPVWWVDANGALEPALVETLAALRRPHLLRRGTAAEEALDLYLNAILRPPELRPLGGEGVLGRLYPVSADPLTRFLSEARPVGRPWTDWLWTVDMRAMQAARAAGVWLDRALNFVEARIADLRGTPLRARHQTSPSASGPRVREDSERPLALPALPGAAAAAYWDRIYVEPDALAVEYAARYRSSYVLVAALAALAAFTGLGAALWDAAKPPLTLAELAALALLLAVVLANLRQSWHERLITYRLLAELCRMQRALALFAYSLPVGETWRVARGAAGTTKVLAVQAAERDAWLAWYFHAALRAAPLPTGVLADMALEATCREVSRSLLDDQLRYHESREARTRRQSRGLAGWGEVLLLCTALLVAIKALLIRFAHEAATVLGVLALFVAVPSATFIALRVYAELEVLAEGSAAMSAMLQEARDRLDRLAASASSGSALALISQEMGAAVYTVAIDMLGETSGWARLFKVKVLEAA